MEEDQNERRPKWKKIKMEEDQNGRCPKWKKSMCCLTSNATKFLNLNVVFTTKTSTLGGKPVLHSYDVIIMLLGLFPEVSGFFMQNFGQLRKRDNTFFLLKAINCAGFHLVPELMSSFVFAWRGLLTESRHRCTSGRLKMLEC